MTRDAYMALSDRLREAAEAQAQHYHAEEISLAIAWTSRNQCEGITDFETLETAMLARLEDAAKTGER